ncbi:MAG: 50S ribosomal protein L2 [Nanoarchaeota archaeon]|nr:50S ribosomal protein L2 [Nanoarchaeota archaeon]
MGKTLTQQARGHGSFTFRVRRKAYRYRITYPKLSIEGAGKIISLINSTAHTAPLAKIRIANEVFYVPSADGSYEGQEIEIGKGKVANGNILKLKDIPQGTKLFNIEKFPGSGGKILRTAGSSGFVMNKDSRGVEIIIRRRIIRLHEDCRAIIGVCAGDGRLLKPFVKAGNKHYLMKAKGRKWHRTSPIKTNAVDHPFGGGRGKRIKSKIAKRNAPPGAKVGHIRPRRTGHIK